MGPASIASAGPPFGSSGGPALRLSHPTILASSFALSSRRILSACWLLAKTRRGAMHVWLWFSVSPKSRQSLTRFRSAPSSMNTASQPESSITDGVADSASSRLTALPVFAEPVRNTLSTPPRIASLAASEDSGNTWIKPSGMPAETAIETSVCMAREPFAAGLTRTAFPAAIACSN